MPQHHVSIRGFNRYSKSLRQLAGSLLIAGATLPQVACSRSAEPASASASAVTSQSATVEQAIVDESAAAFQKMRRDPRFARADFILERARAVMIFPQLVKASLLVGGEGGSGVLVARRDDGTWSNPAFYSVGAPSLGLQLGYQQATVVLFIMDDRTLERTLNSSLALGTKAGATLGYVDENGNTKGNVVSANIYQLVDAEGVFAGVSLDGYVMSTRKRHNRDYYGHLITPREIFDERTQKPEARVLERALAPRPGTEAVSLR